MAAPVVEAVEVLDNTTDADSFATGAITPVAGELVLLFVCAREPNLAVGVPALTNGGTLDLTWSNITPTGTVLLDTSNNDFGVYMWAAIAGATPGSGAVTFDFSAFDGGINVAAHGWMRISGGNVSSIANAVKQAIAGNGGATFGTPGTVTITLGALVSAESLCIGFFNAGSAGGDTISVWSAGSGFTSHGTDNSTSPGNAVILESKVNDTSVDATNNDAASTWIGIAVEVPAAASELSVNLNALVIDLNNPAMGITLGGVSQALAPQVIDIQTPGLGVTLGGVSVALNALAIALSTPGVVASQGGINLALSPAAVTISSPGLGVSLGGVTVALNALAIPLATPGLAIVLGEVSVALSPGVIQILSPGVEIAVPEPQSVLLTAAVITFVAVAPELDPGPGIFDEVLTPDPQWIIDAGAVTWILDEESED